MKILRFILLCLMVFMLGLDGQAQNLQNVSAEHIQELLAMNNSYQLGHFEETIELGKELEEEVTDNNSKFIVFQLMALSYLYMDQEDMAREYASKLLIVAPNYTGENEGPRFNAIIRSLKRGVVTIETASSQAEDISESPVPIVLITEEMIEHSSAQTVGELLKLYVPSISEISGAEDNIAMRGIYGFSQEDVLFLLNGKRLNSGAGNAEAPDFRTTLDKVKRIEVLRGPASSLYGNVALSAVVNIITRKGAELDGSQGALHVGSFNTYGGSFLTGLGGVDHDMMAWASIYTSKGQKDDKNRYRGGYNKKPAYDFGMRGQWKDITIQFSMQHSKLVPHTNVVQMFQDYNRPFYNSAATITLEQIERSKYNAFATMHFEEYDKHISPEDVDRVYDLFDGNTFAMQKTLNIAFSLTEKKEWCTIDTIRQAIDEIIEENDFSYRTHLMSVGSSQKEVLFAIARSGKAMQITSAAFVGKYRLGSASSVQSAVRKLKADGWVAEYINQAGQKYYQVNDYFLMLWIQKKYGRGFEI